MCKGIRGVRQKGARMGQLCGITCEFFGVYLTGVSRSYYELEQGRDNKEAAALCKCEYLMKMTPNP